jgi:dTDP-4-dehydrorhamnose reductase
MTIAVFGGGFLGQRLARALPDAVLVAADIADAAAVAGALRATGADVAVNAAGKTGRPNVDWCEVNREATWRSNAIGPAVLADVCADHDVHLVHLSSGCMFDGPSPAAGGWREDDLPPAPVSYYAESKLAGEHLLADREQVAIVRVRMPLDATPHPRNLVTKLAAYPQVIDVENSVTVVDDLIDVVGALARLRATGVFHATNPGALRHRDLLAHYRQLVDPTHTCEVIPADELYRRGLAIARRSSCLLASSRLEELGLAMRPIAAALPDLLRRYRAANNAHDHIALF